MPKLTKSKKKTYCPSKKTPYKKKQLPVPPARRGFYGTVGRTMEELKTIDTISTAQSLDNSVNLFLMNGVSQGTDYNARIGRKIVMKSFLIRVQKQYNTTVPAQPCNVRWILFYDKQTNGAAPSASDFFQQSASISENMVSPINLNNRDRFIVLKDKMMSLNGSAIATGWFKKFQRINLEVIYNATGNTVGAIQTGSMYLLAVTDFQDATYNLVCDISTRVRFLDS